MKLLKIVLKENGLKILVKAKLNDVKTHFDKLQLAFDLQKVTSY